MHCNRYLSWNVSYYEWQVNAMTDEITNPFLTISRNSSGAASFKCKMSWRTVELRFNMDHVRPVSVSFPLPAPAAQRDPISIARTNREAETNGERSVRRARTEHNRMQSLTC